MDNPTPKRGRGRPKGTSGSVFVKVKIADLINHLGTNMTVVVSKKWLTDIGLDVKQDAPSRVIPAIEDNDGSTDKIQYTIE